jgi:hypothetical protein
MLHCTALHSDTPTDRNARTPYQRAAGLAVAFDATFWDPTCSRGLGCYRSAAHRDRGPSGTKACFTKADNCTLADDRANALAIVTGLAPRHKWGAVARGVLDLRPPSPPSSSSSASSSSVANSTSVATTVASRPC